MQNKSIFFIIVLLFKCLEADKEWIVNKESKNYVNIKAWDEDNFEMADSEVNVRFIKFIEEVHTGDKVEIKLEIIY